MALIVLLAAALSAQPAKLVLGQDLGAELALDASAKAEVSFSTSVGSVSEAQRKGDHWEAYFTPPKVHAPSVALILAQVDEGSDRELYWLAIPMSGSDTMEIETRPGSQVEAHVAGMKLGPATADKNGTARLAMVVPPGVDKGTLRITDKLGNTNEKPLDLDPPPFTRLRFAARDDAAEAGGSLDLEIFAVKPDGTPDDDAKPEMSADAGELHLRKRIAPGVYMAEFDPPRGRTSGTVHLAAKAGAQTASLDVPIKPRGPARLWDSAMVPQRPWGFSAGPIGAAGATFSGSLAGGLLIEGGVRLKDLPLEALLDVGGNWFSEVTQGAGPGTTNASARTYLAQAGVRASLLLGRGVDGHATVVVGAHNQIVHVSSVTLPAGEDLHSWVPRFGLALGASTRFGSGRLLAQLEIDTSASGEAGLVGSLAGMQLQVGYLFPLR